MTPGEYIKWMRVNKKMSQEDLADKLNFDRSTIAKYENNTNQMKYDTIKYFADFFDEPIINIINGDKNASNNMSFKSDDILKKYYDYKLENIKIKHKVENFRIILIFLIVIISLSSFIYFILTNNSSVKSYSSVFENSIINSSQSLIIDNVREVYISLNNLEIKNEKIISISLYYIKNNVKYFIVQNIGNDINGLFLYDDYEQQNYIDFTNRDYILNNLYLLIVTDKNNKYESQINNYPLHDNIDIFSIIKRVKTNYTLDEKMNKYIYNFNTVVTYNNYDYIIKSLNNVISISCKSNNTDITINDKMITGKYFNKNISIYTLNINEDEFTIYNEINSIINEAIKK